MIPILRCAVALLVVRTTSALGPMSSTRNRVCVASASFFASITSMRAPASRIRISGSFIDTYGCVLMYGKRRRPVIARIAVVADLARRCTAPCIVQLMLPSLAGRRPREPRLL